MAETPPETTGPARPGPALIEFGDLARSKFLKLVEAGFGRSLALRECGFKHYRVLSRAFELDPDFLAEVELAEAARDEVVQVTVYNATTVVNPEFDPVVAQSVSLTYLNMRWKVAAMAEAARARRKAEELEERKVRALEGSKDEASVSLEGADAAELAEFRRLARKFIGPDAIDGP